MVNFLPCSWQITIVNFWDLFWTTEMITQRSKRDAPHHHFIRSFLDHKMMTEWPWKISLMHHYCCLNRPISRPWADHGLGFDGPLRRSSMSHTWVHWQTLYVMTEWTFIWQWMNQSTGHQTIHFLVMKTLSQWRWEVHSRGHFWTIVKDFAGHFQWSFLDQ